MFRDFLSSRYILKIIKTTVTFLFFFWVVSEYFISEQSAETILPIANSIPEKARYSPPPSYDELGRGLVYNCKGKHWACVNQDAYTACKNNMNWNTTNGKPQECVTANVYATDEDCKLIQLHNINTLAKTDFCIKK
ncbi:MAG: hypothetical protein HYV97_15685 [Bdellovibrio sp.]|nr:hypothetical protein [Bdellovibrio sp.]